VIPIPISNATPLIYLAKIGILKYLRQLYKNIQIPPEVKVEVVDRGIEEGYSDAFVIEQALKEGWIIVEGLSDENLERARIYADTMKIDLGESQAIFLALQKGEKEILIDQTEVREAAKSLGLIPHGTIYVLIRCCQRGFLTKEQVIDLLDLLIEKNFHISVGVYRKALTMIEKIS